jgi:hypothetical protein
VILPVTGARPHHAIGQQKHRKSPQLPPRHILLITSLTSGSMTTFQVTIQHANHQHMERYPLQLRLHTQEDTQTVMHQRGPDGWYTVAIIYGNYLEQWEVLASPTNTPYACCPT